MGVVYLVGAGPGDPGLLTLRAMEVLRRADVVIYDALANDRLLELAPPDAERICVGKRGGEDCVTQEEINSVLVTAGRREQVVVRLKGGDPFVFGRGGEEALALAEAGVTFEVVPGITAGIAAPAYAGIPITHRGLASTLTLVTAHEDPAKPGSDVAWGEVARQGGTLVIYMGMSALERVVERLIREGMPGDTPAAVIEWGTYARQRTVVGQVAEIAARVEEAGVGAPAIVVIGATVALRDRLRWFERRPLFGKRVVVTRARAQASDFVTALESSGAEVIAFPAIRIVPAADPGPLRRAVRELAQYDWVVFTSVNGVERFWHELEEAGQDARALGGVRVACIGPATAASLELHGIRADVVPTSYVAEAVVEELAAATELEGVRVLLPRAAGARTVLPEGLRERGAVVDEVEAYRSAPDAAGAAELRRRLDAGEVDVVTFTSSSTVTNLVEAVGTDLGGAVVAAIGPVTAETARGYGIRVDVVAEEHTISGLMAALMEYLDRTGDGARGRI